MYPTVTEYTFLSRTQGTFTETNCILGIASFIDTFLMLKIIQNMFSYQSRLKLEIDKNKNIS